MADTDGLVKTKAFIALMEGYEASAEMEGEIQKFCRQKMASFKSPRVIEFMAELPKTGQGKIDKRQLREGGL